MSQLNSKYEALAIAYLTGQATAEEVSEYKHLYNTDAGFKEIVDDVEIWLAPLNENIEDNSPPDSFSCRFSFHFKRLACKSIAARLGNTYVSNVRFERG